MQQQTIIKLKIKLNYTIKDNNIKKMQKILSKFLLLLSKNKLDFNNILRVQKFIIVKLKNCLQDLLNKI